MANKPEAIFILEIDVKKDKTQLFFLKNIKATAFPGLRCFVVVFLCSESYELRSGDNVNIARNAGEKNP